ncbi:MAG: alpha/beta hydrolase, partial [Planctomycetaceae bacterium]|nr:alpha/beta hydrolase [Planctomycetaceae bacterium]
ADTMQTLHNRVGASVLVFDYRGFGRSQGSPNGQNVLADARAARKWLAHREKIHESDIVVMGESIGGAVAVDLAACDGARALVLERTFDDLANVAAHHCPWLPVRWLMRTRLDSAALIGQYHGPLLQVHGDADPVVPLRFGRRLFDTANEPKQFMLLRDFDHDLPLPPKYYDALKTFLKKVAAGEPVPAGS